MQSALDVVAARSDAGFQVAALDSSREAETAPPIDPPAPVFGGTRRQFPRGYCTWYVSTRRNIPWSGNAGAWYAAARTLGFRVGGTPREGAIMVSRESWIGHVAFVESVDGDSFTVSEMNYRGFGIVDQRRVTLGHVPLIGFIY